MSQPLNTSSSLVCKQRITENCHAPPFLIQHCCAVYLVEYSKPVFVHVEAHFHFSIFNPLLGSVCIRQEPDNTLDWWTDSVQHARHNYSPFVISSSPDPLLLWTRGWVMSTQKKSARGKMCKFHTERPQPGETRVLTTGPLCQPFTKSDIHLPALLLFCSSSSHSLKAYFVQVNTGLLHLIHD